MDDVHAHQRTDLLLSADAALESAIRLESVLFIILAPCLRASLTNEV